MLHPVALLALMLLIANDHLFKAVWPGFVTGKLSDFAGLVLFPLLLEAVWELLQRARGMPVVHSRRVFLVAACFTVVGFASIKLLPSGAEAYRWSAGALRWPVHAIVGWVYAGTLPSIGRVALVRDPTDLVALPAAFLGLLARQAQREHAA